jgi:hypothetical protein
VDPDPLAVAVRHEVHRRLHKPEVPSSLLVHGTTGEQCFVMRAYRTAKA